MTTQRSAAETGTTQTEVARELTVEALAQEIRRVDGNHALGASALAEALLPFVGRYLPIRHEVSCEDTLKQLISTVDSIANAGDYRMDDQSVVALQGAIEDARRGIGTGVDEPAAAPGSAVSAGSAAAFLAELHQAVEESVWMPTDYESSDWKADVIDFVKFGPRALSPEISPALRLVMAERHRHKEVEGWTTEHDDAHVGHELALAAAVYAVPGHEVTGREESRLRAKVISLWPWSADWFKPSRNDRAREVVKATSLLLAELERLLRAKARRLSREDLAAEVSE